MGTYRRHFERLQRSYSAQSTRIMHRGKISDNFPISFRCSFIEFSKVLYLFNKNSRN